jgi:hypothetical protein
MKDAVEMSSGVMTYIPSFKKTDFSNQRLIRRIYRHTDSKVIS